MFENRMFCYFSEMSGFFLSEMPILVKMNDHECVKRPDDPDVMPSEMYSIYSFCGYLVATGVEFQCSGGFLCDRGNGPPCSEVLDSREAEPRRRAIFSAQGLRRIQIDIKDRHIQDR